MRTANALSYLARSTGRGRAGQQVRYHGWTLLWAFGLIQLLILLPLLLGGCAHDADVQSPDQLAVSLPATSADDLMERFVTSYGGRDLSAYAALLHEDFRFVFLPSDVQKLSLAGPTWGRDEELASAGRLFCGQPVQKEGGQVLPAITAIVFDSFAPVGEWEPTYEPEEFRGAVHRTYNVAVRFVREAGSTLYVRGQATFHAIYDDGRGRPGRRPAGYYLLGWVDHTGD
jgi:hypothetical protein